MKRVDLVKVREKQKRETSREYALSVLKENIIKLYIQPGTLVSENAIAMELGVSRTPVREALSELVNIGIVEVFPQKGSRISLIDYDLIDETYFMRNLLECEVVKEVCDVITKEDIAGLDENMYFQNQYYANKNADGLLEADNNFHKKLFLIAKKSKCYEVIRSFSIHFDRLRALKVSTSVGAKKTVEDHGAILEAIKKSDKVAAVALMQQHLRQYKQDRQELLDKFPEFFK
jgi:DNA-binding GntR family transcriptional regulator